MKIGFINFTPIRYTVETPYNEPLGGSESSICYLAETLTQQGHEVTLFVDISQPITLKNIIHKSIHILQKKDFQDLDFLVLQNTPGEAKKLKSLLGPSTKFLFWTQHAHDQLAVKYLSDPTITACFDGFIFLSFWQLENYLARFPIHRSQTTILRNAIAPAFLNLFTDPTDIMKYKTQPIMAYTSVPFRGLEHMIEIWPKIRKEIPEAQFHIFSSMQVYQMDKKQEQSEYEKMYEALKKMPGVTYRGSLPQTKLAAELKKVTLLTYPNTFAETACISAMEAMAAGVHVVSSQLGALPETVIGFGDLIPLTENKETYIEQFVEAVVKFWKRLQDDRKNVMKEAGNQVLVANECYNWTLRAQEWERWLHQVQAGSHAGKPHKA